MNYWRDLTNNFHVNFNLQQNNEYNENYPISNLMSRLPEIEGTINNLARDILTYNPQNLPFIFEGDQHSINFMNIYNININDYITKNKVLSEDEFKKLSKGYSTKDCPICLETNEDSIMLPCNHFFHEKCIKKWLLEKSTLCPLCKYDCSGNK